MILNSTGITFECSGRHEYAHAGIIGINPDGEISYGYDGGFLYEKWTDEERQELADYMIQLWTKFKYG